jgi:rsbT co-antagonist protein RsbR
MARIKLDERELASRRSFFEIQDDDLARLAALRPFAEQSSDQIVEDLYRLILGHEATRALLADDATIARVKRAQKQYFLGLFSGRCDLAYAQDRFRVGETHERVGLQPRLYLGAYARYLRLTLERLVEHIPDPVEARRAFSSIQKVIWFDVSLAIDTYLAASLDTLARHQAAIRELSTPVIRVYEGVLLLPIVGTVDSQRAHQIMESLLTRVVEEHAQVVLLDIAGVPTVDTQVADHLIKTTAAVRLLGASTILTGISAEVARTLVQIGVDISTMDTRARLADGIELALGRIGRTIGRKEA